MKGEQSSFLLHNGGLWLPTHKKSLKPTSRTARHGLLTRAAHAETQEVRVCTNRTCRRQGSMQTLQVLTDLSPPDVSVKSCGCLGRCGAGPNVALLPQGIILGHCGTAAQAAQIICGYADQVDANAIQCSLEALALRKRAQKEIELENFSEAEQFLSQAIDLKPFGGLHIIYKYRAIARLATGNHVGALEDARAASRLAPQYIEAYMSEGDVFMAMGRCDEAESSYSRCLKIDPSLRRSKSFKTRIAKLEEKLVAANELTNQQ
ncbi:hypothetical protein Tsubulata_012374 [Turnera subulata]|uniref:Uncharacterized protein n=1 Tax=Turnera subulata TaxID=218843 RepID=A0A9Q0FXG7_9ROSI|nr:hypothetical protein Tsubulata_012374 [Turnera subulata]